MADDHAIVRAGIRQFLEQERGIEVVAEAGDGEEAKHLIEKHEPDVAVLDIQMPKASGIDVTRWVRSQIPNLGILILTAYDDDPYVLAVLQAGANGYVLKTASPAEVIQAISQNIELLPGDLIMMGCPGEPAKLARGDMVSAGIRGVGSIENEVV